MCAVARAHARVCVRVGVAVAVGLCVCVRFVVLVALLVSVSLVRCECAFVDEINMRCMQTKQVLRQALRGGDGVQRQPRAEDQGRGRATRLCGCVSE